MQFYTSINNKDYTLLETFNNKETLSNEIKIVSLDKKNISLESNYLKIVVENASNPRIAEKGWTFIDELIIQ